MNLAGLIRQHARGRPRHVAIEFDGTHLNYAELWQRVATLALRLRAAGVGPGTRVGVALRDHPAYVFSYFAVAGLGAVLVPLDHRWSDAETAHAVRAFGVTHALQDEAAAPIADVTSLRCAALGEARDAADFEPVAAADDDWLVSLSSGSTGKPKGALITHRQMHARFVTQWVSLGFCSTDRFALVTPLHFGAGRSFAMSVLCAGATLIILAPPLSPEAIADGIQRTRANATFLVPTLMRRLLDLPGRGRLFPTLTCLVISGERFYADEVDAFASRLSSHLVGYYASSEGGGISVLQSADFATHGDSVGQVAYGVELELVDQHDAPVAVGEVGRVRYRGPGVTTRALDENGRALCGDDDWFYPGDIAALSVDGYLTLRGREKDMIVRAGVNIYPAEIENVIAALDGVAEVAVCAAPSVSHGETVCAFVVGSATVEAINAQCQAHLAPYKRPGQIRQLDALPRTPAGKTDKRALTELAARVTSGEQQ